MNFPEIDWGEPGVYSGESGHKHLNEVANNILKYISSNIEQYDFIDYMKLMYSEYEKSCMNFLEFSINNLIHTRSEFISINASPAVYKLLIENKITQKNHGIKKNK